MKNLGSSPISLWGALKMVFVGRWSIGNVQIIYLWYDRFIPNPNSFDVVSRTNHCDIELVISMFLVHLDLCSANISRSWNTMCFTGIHQNTEMESSINWWCAWMTKNGIMPFWGDVNLWRWLSTQYTNAPSCLHQIHLPPFCDQRRAWSQWHHHPIGNSTGCNQNNHTSKYHPNVWE